MGEINLLKVKNDSNPNAIAGALAELIKNKRKVEIQAVGAGAVNQTVKAIAVARGYVAPAGINIICIPAFTEVEIDGEERTAMKFIVKEDF